MWSVANRLNYAYSFTKPCARFVIASQGFVICIRKPFDHLWPVCQEAISRACCVTCDEVGFHEIVCFDVLTLVIDETTTRPLRERAPPRRGDKTRIQGLVTSAILNLFTYS